MAEGAGGADAAGTKWEFLGLLPLFDPPRHDTAHTIEECQKMGIGGEGHTVAGAWEAPGSHSALTHSRQTCLAQAS
jgi:hypothetical protein